MNMEDKVDYLKKLQLNVLLAEDDDFNRLYFQKVIDRINCNLDIVADGKEALDKCQTKKYDLIFLDLHMPLLDGLDIIKVIKENKEEKNYHTPFISVSGTAIDSEKTDLIKAGFQSILHKPFTPTSLVDITYEVIVTHTSTKTTNNSETIISLNKLHDLYGDDKELINGLLEAIKKTLPEYVLLIDKPGFYEDAPTMKFLIHKIKPSFGYLGIPFNEFNLDAIEDELEKGIIPANIKIICNTLIDTAKKAISDIEHILQS